MPSLWLRALCVLCISLVIDQVYAGRCSPGGNNRTIYSNVCGGRQIPPSKTRDFRNLRLVCASNASHYVRSHIPLSHDDMEKWLDLDYSIDSDSDLASKSQDQIDAIRQQMQSLWQTDRTKIEWAGSIPYETIEVWDWTDCVYGEDEAACGSYTTREARGKDKDGNTIYEDVKHINSCWHEVDETERRQCSVEEMKFNARFNRPSPREWGPHIKSNTRGEGYYDIIPNKYDLLPGEVEDVQIYNTDSSVFSSGSETMNPRVEIGDAWNEYSPSITSREGTLACRYQTTYHIDVTIDTIKRKLNKRTPNAFRAPVDEYGRELSPIRWLEILGRDGKYIEKGSPDRILLSDASAAIIAAMANQSRKFSEEIERAKAKVEQEQRQIEGQKLMDESSPSKTSKEAENKKKRFHRNTVVRVKLWEDVPYGRDIYRTEAIFWSSGEMQVPGRLGHYEIRLDSQDPAKNPYKPKGTYKLDFILGNLFRFDYRPDRKYYYEVSMFQEGVDFYLQEDGVFKDKFSKPLVLPFAILNIKDERSWIQRLLDFQGSRKSIFLWK